MEEVLPERSLGQKACDRLFLLWLIKKSSPLDTYKLQKLPFRLEYELGQEGKRAFNYEFFQYDQGPLSIQVYEDRDFLKEHSLISVDGYTAQITPEGERLLSSFDFVFESNAAITNRLAEIAGRFSGKTGIELVEDTHEMVIEMNGKRVKVGDLPKYTAILEKPVRTCLEVDPPTLETLIVLFDRNLIANLRQARREGSTSSPYERPISV